MPDRDTQDVLALTAKIVAAHLGKNRVGAEALPALIQTVYASLSTVDEADAVPEVLTTVVPWKKSVFAEFIICLEDGKKLKMLKRYLKSRFNLTPKEYRAKWGLPADYPMVAPGYANRRSKLAKSMGLGRKPGEPTLTAGPARRARGSKG